ncbi:MAG TPA: riboflavin biosynthesis protein RibF [Flavobacterium sp.]|nr:riboflavin biosynthesis protein RibF [Flavobacterium sp.]
MKIHHSIFDFESTKKTIVTLGTFDGVHLGHQKILKKLVDQAQLNNYESVLLTFFPHPRMVLKQDEKIQLLNTINEKVKYIKNMGINHLIIHPFDATFSELSAEDFVEKILVNQLQMAKIIIGYDHKFGKNRSADIHDLTNLGKKYRFDVEQISAQELNDISISSTKIRKALLNGDIELANSYLGYEYELTGTVVDGQKIGRTINFPTANLKITEDYKLIPKNGVYVVSCTIQGKLVFGMLNIGKNPTVNGLNNSIEVHFFNFNHNLYHTQLSLCLLTRIRNEQKFDSLIDLKNQLILDKEYALNFIENYIKPMP